MAWTYEDLTSYPLAAFLTPATTWGIRIKPQVDGHGMASSRWTRSGGFLPVLDNVYDDPRATVRLEACGAMTAALVRVEVINNEQRPHQVVVSCESPGWGENRGWVDPASWTSDILLTGYRERADRIQILGLGADSYSLAADGRAAGPRTLVLVWNLKPGEKRTGWIVRPYRAYLADAAGLRKEDWTAQRDKAARSGSRC